MLVKYYFRYTVPSVVSVKICKLYTLPMYFCLICDDLLQGDPNWGVVIVETSPSLPDVIRYFDHSKAFAPLPILFSGYRSTFLHHDMEWSPMTYGTCCIKWVCATWHVRANSFS